MSALRLLHMEDGIANASQAESVTSFGASGDGVTDDTDALQAALDSIPAEGGVIFLPAGTYLVPNGGLTCAAPVTIVGAGAGTYESGGSRLVSTNPTGTLLTLSSPGAVVEGVNFRYMGTVRPTAGAGLLCTDFDWGRIERCMFTGFWNNMQVNVGYFYSVAHTAFLAPVNYGLYMRNIGSGQFDHGDQVIDGCNFSKYGDTINGGTAVRWESGGGLRIIGSKVNAGTQPGYPGTGFFDNGFVTEMTAGSTSVHTITGCSIEGFLTDGIRIKGSTGTSFGKVAIAGCEFLASGNSGACITVDGVGTTTTNNIVITGNVGYGAGGGITLRNLSKAIVANNDFFDCGTGALNLTNVLNLIHHDNLFGSSINDFDASVQSAAAGQSRDPWKFKKDLVAMTTNASVGKITPGLYAANVLTVKVQGNVPTVGAVRLEQSRVIERSAGNPTLGATVGTDLAVGPAASEVTIGYDFTTTPSVIPKITSASGKSFTGGVEIILNGRAVFISYN
jgi:hypothetical protein